MIFFAYPLGLDSQGRLRALLAWALLAVLLYRTAASFFLVGVQPHLLAFFPFSEWGFEILAASAQSFVTPVFPSSMPVDHRVAGIVGLCALLLFWALFGPALETEMGHVPFAGLLVVSGVAATVSAAIPVFAMSATYWAGHGAALVAMGFAAALFWDSDVRVGWFLWSPIASGSGVWGVPVLFFLVPMVVAAIPAQSMIWYEGFEPEFVVRRAAVPPVAWHSLLLVFGGAVGVLWNRIEGRRRRDAAALESPVPGSAP